MTGGLPGPGARPAVSVVTALVVSVLLVAGVQALVGQLLWENQYDLAGLSDEARAVAADQGRVYVAGSGQGPAAFFLVRAYDGKSGDFLWQDLLDTQALSGTATAIAADQGRVYAVGDAGEDFLVRAYDGTTGDLLWQDRYDLAGFFDSATAVVVDSGLVYVAGGVTLEPDQPGSPGRSFAVVRAYDATSGDLVWQDFFDQTIKAQATLATSITVHGGWLYVAGDRDGDLFLRALDGQTGSLFWQDISASGSATGITADQGFIYAVTEAFVVRAYDWETGALGWEDAFGSASGKAVSVGGGRLYVAGVVPNDAGPGQGYDFLVRAYDAVTGGMAWQDRFHGTGNRTNIALAIDLGEAGAWPIRQGQGITVYAAGFTTSAANNTDWVVQAYDGATGALVWWDAFDRAGGLDEAVAIATDSARVYAAGFVNGNLNGDFFVRAYEAK